MRVGWDPAITDWLSGVINNALYGMVPLPEGGKKSKVTAQLVRMWFRGVGGRGGGGGGPFLGLWVYWKLVLINLLQQLHFYELPSHVTFTTLCWLLTSCRLLKVKVEPRTGSCFPSNGKMQVVRKPENIPSQGCSPFLTFKQQAGLANNLQP